VPLGHIERDLQPKRIMLVHGVSHPLMDLILRWATEGFAGLVADGRQEGMHMLHFDPLARGLVISAKTIHQSRQGIGQITGKAFATKSIAIRI
jgi:hypothetical protein